MLKEYVYMHSKVAANQFIIAYQPQTIIISTYSCIYQSLSNLVDKFKSMLENQQKICKNEAECIEKQKRQ